MRRTAVGALGFVALLAGAQVRAQSPAGTGDETPVERRDRIEVTGSRIVTVDVESANPITIIGADEIRSSGHTSLEMILNDFPQLVADQGSRISNGATGTSAANLRGLLPGRTLVLINGRRLLSGSPFLLAADLNQIPAHLVSRIEILTGGASAVHGSDAIAGVVNVILKDRFEGVEGSVAHDFYNHRQKNGYMQGLVRAAGYEVPGNKGHDGATTSANLTLGGTFAADRGHVAASFRYIDGQALLESERDYSACALTPFNFGQPTQFVACGGSRTGFPGAFVDVGTNRTWTPVDASGNVRTWTRTTDLYNFAPTNYYQRPIERHGFNAFGRYDLGPDARVYAEFGFHDDHTVAQIAPGGIFGGVWTVRWENPFLSDAWRSRLTFRNPDGTRGTGPGTTAQVVIQRRNVEGGGRRSELRHTSFRELVGMKGSGWEPWEIDAFYQVAKVIVTSAASNAFSLSRLGRALDAVADPVTGTPVCASRLSGIDLACVPYNPWRLGGVTAEALDYVQVTAYSRGHTAQTLASVSARGDLGQRGVRLPWARDGVEVALGFERRTDSMQLATDPIFASGDLAGAGESTPSVDGRVSVKELFGEARVPLHDKLSVLAAYRFSDYSTGPRTDTYGIGFNAVPVDTIRLRGSFQQAVRAASIAELFTPQIYSSWFNFPDDPCAGTSPTLTLAQCQRTGVSAARYGNIPPTPDGVGFPAQFGGNPRLEPETAKTTTLGIAFTPTKSFSATVDYFDIRVADFIADGDPNVIFDRCVETGDPIFCGLITRDPATGSLWIAPAQVVAIVRNIGSVRTSGLDVALDYRHGTLGISAVGSYLRSFTSRNYPGAEAVECAGSFTACAEPRPKWRHRLRATWKAPLNVEVSATWRYIHSLRDEGEARLPRLPSASFFDMGASWAFDKRLTLRLAVHNVADRDPPVTTGIGGALANGNTFPQTYDPLGRHVFVSLNARF